eukprot:CAMPEP_0197893514 /NCGR_PEP_ID=MMETSP1439-20131203/32797_1 /TAXON_ID=66791 /ORGANISM="Gonyaulax spinifera, Strain CCMP409" /LENGTH=277 /DNA_ID=CAMNT_0043513783 /DNA_START=118 /DNA_END=951 /DNA_ORIENTATION=+
MIACEDVVVAVAPELANMLSRRGFRRLRHLQNEFNVRMIMDVAGCLLQISGEPAQIELVRLRLDGLLGSRKAVSPALWAELLRTCVPTDGGEEGLVVRLQRQSGCRIHIERSVQEVRLFGGQSQLLRAEILLDEAEAQCSFYAFRIAPTSLDATALGDIARSCGVSVRVEVNDILAMGGSSEVAASLSELRRLVQGTARAATAHFHAEARRQADEPPMGSLATASTRETIQLFMERAGEGQPGPANTLSLHSFEPRVQEAMIHAFGPGVVALERQSF